MTIMEILASTLPFLGIGAVLLVAFGFVFSRLTPYNDRKIAKGNPAVRIRRVGAYTGFINAMAGSLMLSDVAYWTDVMMFAIDGATALVVFAVTYYVIDVTILRRINNAGEIEKGNTAVAGVEACAYTGLGIIMSASFGGGGDQSLIAGLASAALFSSLGLLTLMAVYTVYTLGWTLRGCSLDRQILKGNAAAATDAGGLLVALSATLGFSILGDFQGWGEDLTSYAIAAALSIGILMVTRSLTSLLTIKMGRTRKGVHHGNVGKSLLIAVISVVVSISAGWYTFAYLHI